MTANHNPQGASVMNDVCYYLHKIKCLDCELHYVVCSDFKDWPRAGTTREQTLGEAHGVIYCPECGTQNNKLIAEPELRQDYIYQMVPGESRWKGTLTRLPSGGAA